MSKPSAPKVLTPTGWCVAAVLLAIIAVMTYAGLRMHRGRGPVKPVAAVSRNSPAVAAKKTGRVRASLEALPLAFEANQGQTDPQVKYMARGNGYTVYLTPTRRFSPSSRWVRHCQHRRHEKADGADHTRARSRQRWPTAPPPFACT